MKIAMQALVAVVGGLALAVSCARAQPKADPPPTQGAAPRSAALDQFKALGKAAPLTVLPARLAGTPMPQVGEVVAMMLERGGMTNLETSKAAFTPPQGADLPKAAAAFADFIKANPVSTPYALFTDFQGTPGKGVSEVVAVVVSAQGEVVWQDRQAKGDADFDRIGPREPMQCCILVAERLRPVLGLGDPTSESAPTGKIAQRFQKSSGVPDKPELDAIKQRAAAFKKAVASSTVVVYPTHAGDAFSAESATALVAAINEQKLTIAVPGENGPQFGIERAMNEQKVLWSMAHSFSDWVKKNPPNADYALFADYLMGKGGVGGVHFAICTRHGELVVVDFQNSHWPDFQSINPRTRDDCDKLVIKRLEAYCK